jgi:hypothetical protein
VPAAYGYLLSPGDDSAAGVVRFLQAGGRARVLSRASTFQGRHWPAGSWFIPAFGNEGVQERVTAAGLATLATPVQSGRSEEGIDLGSDRAPPVRLPRVAVLSGEGVSPTSFGAHWFFLEQRLGLPFDALLTGDLARADLTRYDVIVIPEASSTLLEERTRELLRAWIQRGGRLVAVGGGAEAAAPLAEVEVRPANVAAGDTADARRRLLRGREERERADWETQVPGTILPARLDPAHPLAWGAGTDGDAEQLFVLHAGDRVFEPAADVEAVAYFRADLPRISGIISPENLRRLQQGAWLVTRPMGRGSVVLFAGDPLFRMFWRATHPLYVNALLLGPGM